MIYILFAQQTTVADWIREALYSINSSLYNLVSIVFELFFQIAEMNMFNDDLMIDLFSRFFTILGIFMFFKLMISLITYMMNPESINDKERGVGKLIGRVIIMLIFIYLIIPQPSFSFFGDDSVDEKYRGNGLLFGALYDFQGRILKENTLSTLILGQKNNTSSFVSNNPGAIIADNTHSAFFVPSGACDDEAEAYRKGNGFLGLFINNTCNGSKNYIFEYSGVMAFIVALALIVIIFMFSFDVAIRMVKLGILRLLSPIPAISYVDPKSSKDGTFANYTKTLVSTYLDLFLRLAIIFFVIFILANISKQNTKLLNTTTTTGPIAKVIVYVSLLFFAWQAPKFIQQALGIKSKGTGLGFGAALLGGSLSGAAAGFATGGVWGAAKGFVGGANAGSQNQWARQNGQNPGGSARQSARQRGAELGTGKFDPSKSSIAGLIGGKIANRATGTTQKNIDNAKAQMYAINDEKARLDNIMSKLHTGGVGSLSADDQAILAANGLDSTSDHFERDLMQRSLDLGAESGKLSKQIEQATKEYEKRDSTSQWNDNGIRSRSNFNARHTKDRYIARRDGTGYVNPERWRAGETGSDIKKKGFRNTRNARWVHHNSNNSDAE